MQWIKAGIIFLLTLVAFANYTPQDIHNPQQITRLALSLAMTEGRLDIDDYASATVDLATFDGHYYADKPPGLSLLAVPAVALTRALLGLPTGTGALAPESFATVLTAAVLSTVGLLAALASAALYLLCRRLGVSDSAALFATCGLALATPFFGWSTAFFAHAATGSLLLLALALTVWSRERNELWIAPALGLLLGFQLTVDLVAAPAVALLGLFYLLGERARLWQRLAGAAIGGLLGLLPLLVYNHLIFGSPFTLGYSQVVGFAGMKAGLFGLTVPNPAVLGELLFGLYRGLLPLSPLLLLVPLGWWRMWRQLELRSLTAVTIGIGLSFLLINASYFYWDGGSSTGPRHLVGMLPVVALGLAFAWPQGKVARAGVLALLGASVFISTACASVYIFADVRYPTPLLDPILPNVLFDGGWIGMLRVLVPVLGFALLATLKDRPSRTEGHQLAA
jgi:4-amino-4-deoxy-L-arabinose transferase-like glycosyltransferase